jgi:hypothetical protein
MVSLSSAKWIDPARLDPTRTGAIRTRFLADVDCRYGWLTQQINHLVLIDDAFGLLPEAPAPVITNGLFDFARNPIGKFLEWLKHTFSLAIFGTPNSNDPARPWTSAYVDRAYRQALARAFRADLLVDVDGIAKRFGDCIDPWQRDDFAAIDPALQRCNGGSDADVKMRAFLERPRGASKTTDLAVMACWAMAFATRPLKGFAFAVDKDQSRLLCDAMETVCRLNPWLADVLTVESHVLPSMQRQATDALDDAVGLFPARFG